MESVTDNPPLIVIVGQTATGKSDLAMQLAQRFGGEIIAADSRTIYKGMDIGTAKPSPEDRAAVPHHLLDVANPDQRFTVADFQELARKTIADIAARGMLPFLVGGTGLYVDAIIYNFTFRPMADDEERRRLQSLSVAQLQAEIEERGLILPANRQNTRHLVRTLEAGGVGSARTDLRPNTLLLGLMKEGPELERAIRARADVMVGAGLVGEARLLFERFGNAPALQAPAYNAFRQYLAGNLSQDQAKQLFVQKDLQYAKRQKTWFKRNPDIHWISNMDQTVDLVTTFLNK